MVLEKLFLTMSNVQFAGLLFAYEHKKMWYRSIFRWKMKVSVIRICLVKTFDRLIWKMISHQSRRTNKSWIKFWECFCSRTTKGQLFDFTVLVSNEKKKTGISNSQPVLAQQKRIQKLNKWPPFNHCVLDSYGSVPNIEEESYDTENSSASISLSSLHQHQRPPSRACAVRAGRPSEAVAGSARLPQLPLLPSCHSLLPCSPSCQPACWLQKTPLGLESKQKQYSSKKPDKSSDTWLCQIRSIIVSIRYLQCDLGQFTANIYSQITVKLKYNHCNL